MTWSPSGSTHFVVLMICTGLLPTMTYPSELFLPDCEFILVEIKVNLGQIFGHWSHESGVLTNEMDPTPTMRRHSTWHCLLDQRKCIFQLPLHQLLSTTPTPQQPLTI